MAQVKSHLQYLTAKSSSEIIRDFKQSFIAFEILYIFLLIAFLVFIHITNNTFDLKIIIPIFIGLVLLFGTIMMTKVFETAKLLNEKGIMDIVPGLLAALQFILNITPLTSLIIPIFLWAKCRELIRRHLAHEQKTLR